MIFILIGFNRFFVFCSFQQAVSANVVLIYKQQLNVIFDQCNTLYLLLHSYLDIYGTFTFFGINGYYIGD